MLISSVSADIITFTVATTLCQNVIQDSWRLTVQRVFYHYNSRKWVMIWLGRRHLHLSFSGTSIKHLLFWSKAFSYVVPLKYWVSNLRFGQSIPLAGQQIKELMYAWVLLLEWLRPPPTYSRKTWQSWGFASSWTRREVTVSEKRISLPGFACREDVPSPVQVGRNRDSHGPAFPKLSNALVGFFFSSWLSRKLARSLAN